MRKEIKDKSKVEIRREKVMKEEEGGVERGRKERRKEGKNE